MNIKFITAAVVVVLVVAGVAVYLMVNEGGGTDETDDRETVTVRDARGVDVQVKTPVRKVLAPSQDTLDVFAAVYGPGFDKLLVAYPSDVDLHEPSKGALYREHVPIVKDLPRSAEYFTMGGGSFPDEEYASYGADVVFLSKPSMDWSGFDQDSYKLTTASGAAVIWVDFYNDVVIGDSFRENIEIVGKAVGKLDRARQIADLFEREIGKVTSVLKNIPVGEKNKTVYYEFMMPNMEKGASPGMGLPELTVCQARDLAKVPQDMIDQERISDVRDPDTNALIEARVDHVILLATTSFGNTEAAVFGYGKKPSDPGTQDTLVRIQETYLARPGWEPGNFEAANNHEIWLFFPTLRSNVLAFANVQYLAKILYPAYFPDMDVEANINNMCSEFMPYPGDGFFLYGFTLPEPQ